MAGKKKRKGNQGKKVDDWAIAERELSKGNVKLALKHARVVYRQDPSEKNRSLLRRSLLSRAQDLRRRNMREPACAVLTELNSLENPTPHEEAEINRLNALLGIGDANANEHALASNRGLLLEVVDDAVTKGPGPGCPNELVGDAKRVRQALEAIEAGQDEQARELLANVERSSPFADWKFFTRGLIAFYAGDMDRRDANWSRLDASRPPRNIAETLTVAAGGNNSEIDSPRLKSARAALTSPLITLLRRLQTDLRDDAAWSNIYGELKRQFSKSEPEVLRRVTEVLASKFVKELDSGELDRLRRAALELPSDPRFNRAYALFHELDEEVDDAIKAWGKYVDDLARCDHLPESRRNVAIALVRERMAGMCVSEAKSAASRQPHPFMDRQGFEAWRDELVDAYYQAAELHYELSRHHDPMLCEAFSGHGQMLVDWGKLVRATSLYKEFGRRFEGDCDVLLEVAEFFLEKAGDPGTAKSYARRAEQLRPRNGRVADQLWLSSFDCARLAARQKQFGIARTELDEAEKYYGPARKRFVLASMRAAVELKAGNTEGAERHVATALEHANSEPVAMLAVCANAFRCGVSSRIRGNLNSRLKKAIQSKRDSETAGELAHFMNSITSSGIEYHGIKTHIKLVAEFIRKYTRRSWNEADIVHAWEFASSSPDHATLLKKLSQRGVRLFPQNPHFYFGLAVHEMSLGPDRCDCQWATYNFERALELSEDGDVRLDEALVQIASLSLRRLRSYGSAPGIFGSNEFDDEFDESDSSDLNGPLQIPAELQEILDELGVGIEDLLESVARGESPQEFIERHAGPQSGQRFGFRQPRENGKRKGAGTKR